MDSYPNRATAVGLSAFGAFRKLEHAVLRRFRRLNEGRV